MRYKNNPVFCITFKLVQTISYLKLVKSIKRQDRQVYIFKTGVLHLCNRRIYKIVSSAKLIVCNIPYLENLTF